MLAHHRACERAYPTAPHTRWYGSTNDRERISQGTRSHSAHERRRPRTPNRARARLGVDRRGLGVDGLRVPQHGPLPPRTPTTLALPRRGYINYHPGAGLITRAGHSSAGRRRCSRHPRPPDPPPRARARGWRDSGRGYACNRVPRRGRDGPARLAPGGGPCGWSGAARLPSAAAGGVDRRSGQSVPDPEFCPLRRGGLLRPFSSTAAAGSPRQSILIPNPVHSATAAAFAPSNGGRFGA